MEFVQLNLLGSDYKQVAGWLFKDGNDIWDRENAGNCLTK